MYEINVVEGSTPGAVGEAFSLIFILTFTLPFPAALHPFSLGFCSDVKGRKKILYKWLKEGRLSVDDAGLLLKQEPATETGAAYAALHHLVTHKQI